ncbi:VOC family protein [Microlunatus sp. Gsoil 973]|jgi:catechol 2,3-dioxygenase-like lactoylglutathione lyase family enzyme|uniref:VOC family protein n=1 Tax=Microlunatus sp. Gsoil 973 TaxID=2672569 RepID=UPI0012B4BB65|nr:VOC family protein [Microlunatus sp. Gsoil 973]QGN32505.1 VOC family protein [Microlunatus sp. Gsoil 973]
MTNLENLRKQARQLLRWHRERNYAVAARIRAGLPRYHGLSDEQILAQRFVLADAQLLLAREAGYETWATFKAQLAQKPQAAAASDPGDSPPAVLTRAEPQLFVSDVNAACEFFERELGFQVVFTHGDPPYYGQVRRDNVSLNLRYVCEPVYNGTVRDDDQLLSAVILVDNVKALYTEYVAADVEFQQTLQRQPWGAHQFVVRDPEGNLILFSGE